MRRWVAKLREMGGYIYIGFSPALHFQMFNGERQRFNLGDGIEVFSILQFTAELCTIMNVFIINILYAACG